MIKQLARLILTGILVALLGACSTGGPQSSTAPAPTAVVAAATNPSQPATATTAPTVTTISTERPNTPTVGPTTATPTSLLRIRNSGAFPIKNLTVLFPDEQIDFGDVPVGATTGYRPALKGVYRYAAYRFDLNGETMTQPVIDWVGEEAIQGAAFTYTIDFDPSRTQIHWIQLIRVEESQPTEPGSTATSIAPTVVNPGLTATATAPATTLGPFANSKNSLGALLGTISAPEGWNVVPCEREEPFICVLKGTTEIGRVELSMYPIETMTDFQQLLKRAGIPYGATDYADPENEKRLEEALQAFVTNYHSTFEKDRTVEYGNRIQYLRLETQQVRVGKLVGMRYGFAGIRQDGSVYERWLSTIAFDGDLVYIVVAHYRPDSLGSFQTDQELQLFAPHLVKIVTGLNLPVPTQSTQVKSVKAQKEVLIFRVVGGSSNPVGRVAAGQTTLITGVSPNGQWWRIDCPKSVGENCWISADPQMTKPAQ